MFEPKLGREPLLLTLKIGRVSLRPQLGLLLPLVELELVGNLRGLLVPSLTRAEHLAFELEALEILSLLLRGALELELGAGLDGLIVHLLKTSRPLRSRDRRPC